MNLIRLLFLVSLLSPVFAHAIRCEDLTKTSAVLEKLPNRVLMPLELAHFTRDYALENEAEIIQRLQETKPDRDGRVYVRLVFLNHLTVWAHRWVGVPTDIHDHPDSKSGVYILRGQMVEEFYRPPNPQPVTRVLQQGRFVGQGGKPMTHRLLGDNDSISIHAYSPRIDDVMTIFEIDEGGDLVPVRDSTGAVYKK